jgi:hypothetical protein
MQGIYHLLSWLPVWAFGAILVLVVGLIPFGRGVFEGFEYQVSRSAMPGYLFLISIAMFAANFLKKPAFVPTIFDHHLWLQWTVLFLAFIFGVCFSVKTLDARDGQFMDVYHDLVVVPIFLSLAIFLLPVIFMNGKVIDIIFSLCLILLWLLLLMFDLDSGRLNQREWLREHYGVRFREDFPQRHGNHFFSALEN